MLETLEIELWIPPSLEKKLKSLTNHKGMHIFIGREGDLITAAAILGWEQLKDVTPEQILAVLEEATLKDVKL
jgi:hypothetical protein